MLKELGERIRTYREKRGLTRAELAERTGLHVVQIHRYEKGEASPTAERIVALSEALRVSTDALLRGDRKGEERIEFKNVHLHDRFQLLESLPRHEQQTALEVLDAIIARYEHNTIAERRRAS